MRTSIVLLAAGLTLAPIAAPAQQVAPASTPSARPAPNPDDPNAIVCRAGEVHTGSLIKGKRECHTRAQWAQIQRDSQDAILRNQMKSYSNGVH